VRSDELAPKFPNSIKGAFQKIMQGEEVPALA